LKYIVNKVKVNIHFMPSLGDFYFWPSDQPGQVPGTIDGLCQAGCSAGMMTGAAEEDVGR
jgi:hypothetical protein